MNKFFVSGVFTLLLALFGDHQAKANQNDLSLNINENNIAQEGIQYAGCPFDGGKQLDLLNSIKDAMRNY